MVSSVQEPSRCEIEHLVLVFVSVPLLETGLAPEKSLGPARGGLFVSCKITAKTILAMSPFDVHWRIHS